MEQLECPFCHLDATRINHESEFAVAFSDGFPVTEGHALVIPKRHVDSLFELSEQEQADLWKLVALVRAELQTKFQPDGFNIGLNDGVAAGQTVMHAHIHIIPRRHGDAADPKGGVRWIIPDKANYWSGGQK